MNRRWFLQMAGMAALGAHLPLHRLVPIPELEPVETVLTYARLGNGVFNQGTVLQVDQEVVTVLSWQAGAGILTVKRGEP